VKQDGALIVGSPSPSRFSDRTVSSLSGKHSELARRIVAGAAVRHHPDTVGIAWDEIVATLWALAAFVHDGDYWCAYASGLVIEDHTLGVAHAALEF